MTEVFRMEAAAGGIELKRYEDLIFSNIDIQDPIKAIKSTREFNYMTGDILMCSYPKCGTHWLGNMIWKLKTLEHSSRPVDALLEFGPAEIFEHMESPRVIITHIKPSRLPPEHLKNKGKIVLMLRNPKDAMVSFYHHMKNAVLIKSNQTWDELFQSYISGLVPFGSYFDYVHQWEQFLKEKSCEQQVEIFYYEDFKANPKENLVRLNDVLGFNRDKNYLKKVMDKTTFLALKEQDAMRKGDTLPMARDENGDSIIYRKGEVGDWKNYLTVKQSDTVDKIMDEELTHGIINIKYDI